MPTTTRRCLVASNRSVAHRYYPGPFRLAAFVFIGLVMERSVYQPRLPDRIVVVQ